MSRLEVLKGLALVRERLLDSGISMRRIDLATTFIESLPDPRALADEVAGSICANFPGLPVAEVIRIVEAALAPLEEVSRWSP